MRQTKNVRLVLNAAFFAALASSTSVLAGTTAKGDLFYTRYQGGGGPRVAKVSFDYDGTTATLGAEVPIVQSVGADGIIFSPNGNLLIGGQGAVVHEYTTSGVHVSSGNAINASFHLSLDPSGTKVWTSPFGGPLADLPLAPNVGDAPVAHAISGAADRAVTQIAFAPSGKVFYVNGNPNGFGNLGEIDLGTFTTTQFAQQIQSAHGLVYDSFTDLMTTFGAGKVGTFDPDAANPGTTILQSALLNGDFDQGAVDGKGHALVAGNNSITFIDYSVTKDITSAENYVKIFSGFTFIDDVAPLSGLGSTPTPGVPDAGSTFALLGIAVAGIASMRSRISR